MATWNRKRDPDDVPTPVAVALSDYCRRAGAPASAAEVRQALALLSPDDDFRLRALADGEPPAKPLGPFAAVDVLGGTAPDLAAERQRCGYYDLARDLAEERLRTTPPPPPAPAPAPASAPSPSAAPAVWSPAHPMERPARGAKVAPPTVAEKIAPKKRTPGAAAVTEEEAPTSRRELPAPRGRFTRVEGARRPANELFDPQSKDLLEGLAEQHPHRYAIHRALAAAYAGRAGSVLGVPDTLEALDAHGLLPALARREKDAVLGSVTEHRGALGRVAWALSINPADLGKLVDALDLGKQVDAVREQFRREALDARNFSARLDLIGRSKYLADLGIEKRFTESLRGELRAKLLACVADSPTLEDLFAEAGKRHGVSPERLARAAERLRLTEDLSRKLRGSTPPSVSP